MFKAGKGLGESHTALDSVSSGNGSTANGVIDEVSKAKISNRLEEIVKPYLELGLSRADWGEGNWPHVGQGITSWNYIYRKSGEWKGTIAFSWSDKGWFRGINEAYGFKVSDRLEKESYEDPVQTIDSEEAYAAFEQRLKKVSRRN